MIGDHPRNENGISNGGNMQDDVLPDDKFF